MDINLQSFEDLVFRNLGKEEGADVMEACRMVFALTDGQTRYSGEPFVMHALGVASIVLSEIGLGYTSTIAALLHDPVRLGQLPLDDVTLRFGEKVSELLIGLTRISDVDPKVSVLQEDNFKELIVSYSTDPRIILIKLADRLEVMRSLSMFPSSKRTKKSWETLHLYAPIAHKLGLYSVKGEMEDLAFKYLEPESYNYIQKRIAESEDERQRFIAGFVKPITGRLDSMSVSYKLKSRTKSVYSIWKKMKRQNVDFDGVFDLFAIRIILDCEPEREKMLCWTVFSVVTDFYTPNPDRMRDWISIPKSNGYESLHTTVVTPEGKWVEVQIRTVRMDDIAEHGLAAHWKYKGLAAGGSSSSDWMAKVREIVETSHDGFVSDRFDFESVSSEIFVFTPKGDLRKLPAGATLLDFAFDIHTDVGSACTGGRINGKNVPIRHQLHNGDIVEVTTSKNQVPKQSWLSFVKTSKARARIQQVLRQQAAEQAKIGREELERKIRNWKLQINVEAATSALTRLLKIKTTNELLELIATGRIPASQVKSCLVSFLSSPSGEPDVQHKAKTVRQEKKNDIIEIGGYGNGMDYKMAGCCHPVAGDDIFGFVTVSSGVTIHRLTCPNASRLLEGFPYRVIPARWKLSAEHKFLATFCISAYDRTGLTHDITDLLEGQLNIPIRQISLVKDPSGVKGEITLEVANRSKADSVIATLKHVKGINRVSRKS